MNLVFVNLKRILTPPYSSMDVLKLLVLFILLLSIPLTMFILNKRTSIQSRAQDFKGMMSLKAGDKALEVLDDNLGRDPENKCRGLFKLKDSGNPALDRAQCTHGPDLVEPGQPLLEDTPPIAYTTQESRVLGTSVACIGDGLSGNRVEVIYARASDKSDRYSQYLTSFQTWTAGMDEIFKASAAETGGSVRVRFVHDASCVPVIRNEVLSSTGDDSFGNVKNELMSRGYNRTDRKYLVYLDGTPSGTSFVGIANLTLDDRPDSTNANNRGPTFAVAFSSGWNSNVAAHEIMHTIGGVQITAPHTNTPGSVTGSSGHCIDEYDRMCEQGAMQYICKDSAHNNRFDCNHDDYFHTNPPAGSYLATKWNTANSSFLHLDGSVIPTPTSAPLASPTPIPTKTPTPTPTPNQTTFASPTPTRVVSSDTISPLVTLTTPTHNSTVRRNASTTISATASDNNGVVRVEFTVTGKGGGTTCTDTTSPYTCSWNVSPKPSESYLITSRAYDAANNVGTHTIQVLSSN